MIRVLWILSLISSLYAQDPPTLPKPGFPTGSIEEKTLVEEHVYNYKVMRYVPAVKVDYQLKRAASYDTPEETLISRFSAMRQGDYDWFQETWTLESRAENERSNQTSGHDAAFWIATWNRVLSNHTIELVARIESGPYILIQYQLVSTIDGDNSFRNTLALVKEEDRWLVTQKLAGDPVRIYWEHDNPKPRKPIR